MENLGKIGVSFAAIDDHDELLRILSAIHALVAPEERDLDRVVLIVPDSLRARLGWSAEKAPVVAVYAHDLVFHPAP